MKRLLLLLPLFLLLTSFHFGLRHKILVIDSWPLRPSSGDTIFVPYHTHALQFFNDTIRKYCGKDTAAITTIFLNRPELFIDDMQFSKRFPRLKHLALIGGRSSYLDTVRYDFFDCPNLNRISICFVRMRQYPDRRNEWPKKVRKFIKSMRPDVWVRFKRPDWKYGMGHVY